MKRLVIAALLLASLGVGLGTLVVTQSLAQSSGQSPQCSSNC
jgi:hypothetical protein